MAKERSFRDPIILGQDGPWLISVAESPYNDTFCLYIKTPTHNRVLIRQRAEIITLDSELRALFPSLTLPRLCITPSNTPLSDKREHSIRDLFGILSKFSPPEPDPIDAGEGYFSLPLQRQKDIPILKDDSDTTSSPASIPEPPDSVSVAGFLSALSSMESVRVSEVWRRFTRVERDDLESKRKTVPQ